MRKTINDSKNKIIEINNLIYKKCYEEAENQINNYKIIYGADSYVLLSEGKLYFELAEYQKEIELLEPLIESNPKNIGYILYEIAKAYKMLNNEIKSLETYLMIENTNHKDKEYAYYEIACLYYKMSDYNTAKKYFYKVIYNNGYHQEKSKIYLAKIEMKKENYEEAEKILNTVICKKNTSLTSTVLYNKAKIYKSKEQYQEAEELLLKLINSYDSGYIMAYLELIQIYCKKDEIKEATRYYDKIKDRIEWTGYSSFIIAEYKSKLGLFDEALELYKKSITNINEKYFDIALLGISQILMTKNNLEEAEQYLKKIQLGDYYNHALKKLVSIEIKKHNFNKAYEIFLKFDRRYQYDIVDVERLKLILMVNADIQTVLPLEKSYVKKQIINYSKEDAIEHIKQHMKMQKESNSYFNQNIKVEKLYEEIQPLLTKENLYSSDLFNKYKIKYPNIGICDDKLIDELIVVTKSYNTDIITMYPNGNYLEEPQTEEYEAKIKVKRLSQIEKFNMKYKRTN